MTVTPLGPPPLQAQLTNTVLQDTPWGAWFTQMWSFARGTLTSTLAADGTMVANIPVIADGAALIELKLPTRFPVGALIQVVGKGAGGWQITQNAGQTIHRPAGSTTTGVLGTVSSTNRYDAILLKAITEDTELSVVSSSGTLTFV